VWAYAAADMARYEVMINWFVSRKSSFTSSATCVCFQASTNAPAI
jgi:hypothetical protein